MYHRRPITRLALLTLGLLLFTSCSLLRPKPPAFGEPIPSLPDTVSVQIDGGQRFQTIDGFGANINGTYWNGGAMAPALDALHADLGATIFRVILETHSWEKTNDDGDPRSFNQAAYDAIYARAEFQSLFGIIRHLQQMPDAQVVLNVMGTMPAWMGDGAINPASEDEWVEMVTSLLIYARDREGLSINLLSPFNEIDVGPPEGPKVDPAQCARLLHALVLRLDGLGLKDVRLIAPELTYSTSAKTYLPPLLADDLVMSKLATFAVHDYGGDIMDIRSLLDSSTHPELRFWLSEYSQWCEACQTSEANTEPWSLGADTASFLLRYLGRGASAALLYDGVDGYYLHHGRFQAWGVLAYNPDTGAFTPRMRFHTSAQIFRFVRPGMVRVAASPSSDGLSLLAFVEPHSGALSIVGRNPTSHTVTIQGSVQNLGPLPTMRLFQTTAAATMASSEVSQTAEGFSVTVDPDSIFALSSMRP